MISSLKDTIRKEKKKHSTSIEGTNQTTFIIEALLLMVCLMMVIAVSVAVIAYSVQANYYYSHKEAAITLASNTAEMFAANPSSLEGEYVEGELRAVCDVTSFDNQTGTVYDATISVEWNEEEVYLLNTSKYVPKLKGGE